MDTLERMPAAIDTGDKTGIDFPTTANVPIRHEISEKVHLMIPVARQWRRRKINKTRIASATEMDRVFFLLTITILSFLAA